MATRAYSHELTAAIRRYVTAGKKPMSRYMELLHGNFMRLEIGERQRFLKRLGRAASQVTDRELATLFEGEWRSRLTATWLIGLGKRQQFRDRIGQLLLASEDVYAGQGYCLALARFATPADAALLTAYLDAYLPHQDKRYDQDWALGALLHVDAVLGTDDAQRFLDDGLWQQWRRNEPEPDALRAWIDQLCEAADEAMRPG